MRYEPSLPQCRYKAIMYISLQLITGEHLIHQTANWEEGARLDVAGANFWGNDQQRSFFDIRVSTPLHQVIMTPLLLKCYSRNELEKKGAYDQRVGKLGLDLSHHLFLLLLLLLLQ